MTVRVGVVGLGRQGFVHLRNLAEPLAGAQLVAVADNAPGRAQAVAQRFGVPHWHADPNELLARADVDAVVIATPSATHLPLVQAAASAGKPIFCEKPLALTMAETDRAIAAAETAGVPLQLGFHYHFIPAYQHARSLVEKGRIGKPLVFKAVQRDEAIPPASFCDPAASGGLVIDMGIHEFDAARWFLGDEIIEVHALAPPPVQADIAAVGDIEHVLVHLRFRSGAVGSVEVGRNARYPDESRHEIVGEDGTILLGALPQTNLFVATKREQQGTLFSDHKRAAIGAYHDELAAFIRVVAKGEQPPVDGEASRAALQIALAAGESLRSGKPEPV
jgi:predicted dehydrogenase